MGKNTPELQNSNIDKMRVENSSKPDDHTVKSDES